MSEIHFSANLSGKPFADKPVPPPTEDFPDIPNMVKEIKAHTEKLLARDDLVGELREEMTNYLEGLSFALSRVTPTSPRYGRPYPPILRGTAVDIRDTVSELHDHDIMDTEPLERIAQELEEWMDKQPPGPGRGR